MAKASKRVILQLFHKVLISYLIQTYLIIKLGSIFSAYYLKNHSILLAHILRSTHIMFIACLSQLAIRLFAMLQLVHLIHHLYTISKTLSVILRYYRQLYMETLIAIIAKLILHFMRMGLNSLPILI